MKDKKSTVSTKSLENRKNLNSKLYWEKEKHKISITSYAVNAKSAGKRNIFVLSTVPPLLFGLTKDLGKKKLATTQVT